jgi:hypothetical protein
MRGAAGVEPGQAAERVRRRLYLIRRRIPPLDQIKGVDKAWSVTAYLRMLSSGKPEACLPVRRLCEV